MRITFIKPAIGSKPGNTYVEEGRMEPLTLGVLAGLTPPDVECVLYDDRMESIPYEEPTDLVAITVETYTARRAYDICDEYRRRGVPVIAGGIHVTLLPGEAGLHVDSVFIGDAESLWSKVVEDARHGRLQPVYRGQGGVGQSAGSFPRRDLFEGKGYLPITLLQFSRGCGFSCDFCAVSGYFNARHYTRRIDEVLKEIERQGRRLLFFVDDNMAMDKKALRELCLELIPLKVRWVSQASLDMTHNHQLMESVVESGCLGTVCGFESISEASLRETGKAPNINAASHSYEQEIASLRSHGLQTWAAFTLGFDHDTRDSIEATLRFALKNRFAFGAFNILMPYPGTRLYDKLHVQKRLLYGGKWWLHPDYRFNSAAFMPAGMTPDELTEGCRWARKKFNSLTSLAYRFADVRTNLRSASRAAAFLHYGLLFRRELKKKEQMQLGLR